MLFEDTIWTKESPKHIKSQQENVKQNLKLKIKSTGTWATGATQPGPAGVHRPPGCAGSGTPGPGGTQRRALRYSGHVPRQRGQGLSSTAGGAPAPGRASTPSGDKRGSHASSRVSATSSRRTALLNAQHVCIFTEKTLPSLLSTF